MDIETRIANFRQMSEADPDNELGHFSLGRALLDAERPSEAIAPLKRAIDLNPTMSKAYQILGEAYAHMGDSDSAVQILTKGAAVADQMGDRVPRDAMAAKLKELGAEVPEFAAASPVPAGAPSGDQAQQTGFHCSRCGRPDQKMEKPPFRGELGSRIERNVCQGCWQEWILMGTKVINELGLQLSTDQGQEMYDMHMIEFLQLEGRE